MEASIVNTVIESALHILGVTANLTPKLNRPFSKKSRYAPGDISGLISVKGDIEGSISITFTEKCILSVVSAMFSEEITELNNDVKDAAGELTNMIAGRINTKFAEMGKKCRAEMKEVRMDKNHLLEHLPEKQVFSIPFEGGAGYFNLEICI
ncbi:chemotaxis protein CheX [Desulforegula conservatrix]|uniref:chemotaxis protein CheX n=1 Tax=Desulforegula conservatrix TaxID=153026 RepID=UPI00041EB513|nr:chemotaxis protein CheX [Desulforegula conservatrix]